MRSVLLIRSCGLLFQLAKRLCHSSERVLQVELLKGDKGNHSALLHFFCCVLMQHGLSLYVCMCVCLSVYVLVTAHDCEPCKNG